MTKLAMDRDPITSEIIRHRVEYIARQMGATLEAVGGTVNTTQMRDYMSAIYTGDGRIIAVGESPAMHVPCAARAVRTIIAKFPGDVHDGDVFVLNDPYVAAFHQSDVYVISPVFYGDVVAFWAGSFVHVMDIGAMSPGGDSPDARTIYQEGLRLPGIRLVSSGKLAADLFDMMLAASRQPGMMGLDIKCQLAAHEVVRRELVRTLEEFGAEVVADLASGLIDFSASELARRLDAMSDGTWSEHSVIVEPGVGLWRIMLRLEKHGASLKFDFSGTDEQAVIGVNLPEHATLGACFEALLHGIAFDLPKNEGLFSVMDLVAPAGSIVAARPPAPVSLNTTSGAAAAKYAVKSALARMLGSNPDWRDELAPPDPGGRRLRTAGINQDGDYYASSLAQPALSGGGAQFSRDGLDSSPGGYRIAPNVEWVEMKAPLLFLYRRHTRDGAGAGRQRGGAGAELAFTTHGITHRLNGVAFGVAGAEGRGFAGGFPGCASIVSLHSRCGLLDRRQAGGLPSPEEELGGVVQELGYCEFEFGEDDAVYYRLGQGGGFGDPLERSPEAVALDCRRRIVSRARAQEAYGVVLDDLLQVDLAATDIARDELRSRRLQAPPAESEVALEWELLVAQGIVTAAGDAGGIACGACGSPLRAGPTSARWIRTDLAGVPAEGNSSMVTAICGGCGSSIGSARGDYA